MFKTYTPTRHTALVFTQTGDEAKLKPVTDAVRTAPKDAVQVVVVLPKGTAPTITSTVEGVDLVLVDTLGHAADSYLPAAKGFPVFIVRPDGVVGAVVRGEEGIRDYTKGIFVR